MTAQFFDLPAGVDDFDDAFPIDDVPDADDDFGEFDCGMGPNGCTLAGTEQCDFDCRFRGW